ncbi:hypothetical protein [Microbacterium lacticum]|uniref:hypothetical protein n=1 Tax=Microbacterium lacticum TaxID=33885 RepID=UPI001F574F1D|nr:hypothetical protein [Microbacterium lacticum]
MDLNIAHAQYDDALARYTEALARFESGDTSAGLAEEVHRLYGQTLAAHAALTEAAAAPQPVADQPVAAEQPVAAQPVAAQSAPAESVIGEQPIFAQPVAEQTAFAPEPVAQQASFVQPRTEQPAASFDLSEATPAPAPVTAAAHAGLGADAAEQPPVLGRRQTLSRFSPPPSNAAPEQPLRRDVLSSLRTDSRSEIGRERKVAGNLPEWSPLPPDEILAVVRR